MEFSGGNVFEIMKLSGRIPSVEHILVSVVLCTYNRRNSIKNTIESVLAQTHNNWELHIWDDGGTDDTQAVVESYNDIRIKYYKGKHHYVTSKNEVLRQTAGEYVMFLDAGDTIAKNKIKGQLEYLVFSRVDGCMVRCDQNRFSDYGEVYRNKNGKIDEQTGYSASLMLNTKILNRFSNKVFFYDCFNTGSEDQGFLNTLVFTLGANIHTIAGKNVGYELSNVAESVSKWDFKNTDAVVVNHDFISECFKLCNSNYRIENPLIFDLGLYKADTSLKYMYLGYNVVGVECNEDILKQIHYDDIVKNRLTIEHKCISDKDDEEISFYVSTHDDWCSAHKEIAERYERSREIKVRTITLPTIIKKYGCPVYCKIDIEGNDIVALRTLHQTDDRPKYISCETECLGVDKTVRDGKEFEVLNELKALGYTKFHLEKQPSDVLYNYITDWKDYDTIKKELSYKRDLELTNFWYDVYATY